MSKKETFGDRLRLLRNRLRRNQETIANDLGISRARYSHYENNHVEPDLDLLKKIAEYYDVTVDYLLGRSFHENLSEEMTLDEQVEELYKILQSMPEEEREDVKKQILTYAKFLADANKD